MHLKFLFCVSCTPKKAVSPSRAGTVSSTFFFFAFLFLSWVLIQKQLAKNSINIDRMASGLTDQLTMGSCL